jgi:hypothetical protein
VVLMVSFTNVSKVHFPDSFQVLFIDIRLFWGL